MAEMTNWKLIGKEYLTASGLPVRVTEIGEGCLVLQSLASDNQFAVPAGYPLEAPGDKAAAFPARSSPYGGPYVRPRRERPWPKPLAPIIDALLLAGNMTMRGIVREVKRKDSASCHGKDLKANVRARLYWLRRKGYEVEVDGQSRMKVTPAWGSTVVPIA